MEIESLLDAHNLQGEIHTAWMARRYPEQERITGFASLDADSRRAAVEIERKADLAKASMSSKRAVDLLSKNYRKSAAYIHLTYAERVDLLRAIADCIAAWSDATLFAEAQRKSIYAASTSSEHILETAFEQVVSRYHHFLNRVSADMGIIVQDRNDAAAERLTMLARRYHARGTRWSTVSRLVETPLFVDSQLTSMVQLADLCGYAIRRFFENKESDLFD